MTGVQTCALPISDLAVGFTQQDSDLFHLVHSSVRCFHFMEFRMKKKSKQVEVHGKVSAILPIFEFKSKEMPEIQAFP